MVTTPDKHAAKNGIFHEKLRTANDPIVKDCVSIPGSEHDLRPYKYSWYGREHTSLVCVWCAGVACGDPDQLAPCVEIYHHRGPHRLSTGETWPIGGSRPEPVERL